MLLQTAETAVRRQAAEQAPVTPSTKALSSPARILDDKGCEW